MRSAAVTRQASRFVVHYPDALILGDYQSTWFWVFYGLFPEFTVSWRGQPASQGDIYFSRLAQP